MSIRIVADENIARAQEALGHYGDVRLMHGRAIDRDSLMNADALVVRSITKVNAALLEGTPVRFVGTATIGTDHIDFPYLGEHNIAFADAAGGGSRSVAEYVVAALLELRERELLNIAGEKLGVIGVGAIGSKVVELGRCLGMDVLEYDPPRASAESDFHSVALEDILRCDVIVLAVPLNRDGEHPTLHLVDSDFLSRLPSPTILINAARGPVVDSAALGDALRQDRLKACVLDVWEGEPEVPVDLLRLCAITTPHIAGYSRDGKLRGTEMMAEALARHLGVENRWRVADVLPAEAGRLDLRGLAPLDATRKIVSAAYDICADDQALRTSFSLSDTERRKFFDALRKNYGERREFPAWRFVTENSDAVKVLGGLGFRRVETET